MLVGAVNERPRVAIYHGIRIHGTQPIAAVGRLHQMSQVHSSVKKNRPQASSLNRLG